MVTNLPVKDLLPVKGPLPVKIHSAGMLMKILPIVAMLLAAGSGPTFAAAKPCEELKTEIAAILDGKHVVGYTLDIVPAGDTADGEVVGTCDGGTK
jgi:hypothetical protein